MSLEGLTALTFERELDKIERFNRLIASAEWRWNALLHEIERRRAFFAEKVRRERPNIEAPKFKTITADTNAPVN